MELHHVHLLGRKLLGETTIPLHAIRHSNKVHIYLGYICICIIVLNICQIGKECCQRALNSSLVVYSPLLHLQECEGQWMFLFLRSETGFLLPTAHQLQFDAYFELPQGEFASHVIPRKATVFYIDFCNHYILETIISTAACW